MTTVFGGSGKEHSSEHTHDIKCGDESTKERTSELLYDFSLSVASCTQTPTQILLSFACSRTRLTKSLESIGWLSSLTLLTSAIKTAASGNRTSWQSAAAARRMMLAHISALRLTLSVEQSCPTAARIVSLSTSV